MILNVHVISAGVILEENYDQDILNKKQSFHFATRLSIQILKKYLCSILVLNSGDPTPTKIGVYVPICLMIYFSMFEAVARKYLHG